MNQGQGGSKERGESPEQRDIRVMWVHQDQEVPLDNKGPQVSQVTRVNKDLKEREDLKVLRGKKELLVFLGNLAFLDFQAYLGRKARKDTMEQRALQETLEKLGHQGNEDFLASEAAQEEQDWLGLQVLEEQRAHQACQEAQEF